MASDPTVGYFDFIRLCNVSGKNKNGFKGWGKGLRVRPDGVYVKLPKCDFDLLSPAEVETILQHHSGNPLEPDLTFPCTLDELEAFVDRQGLNGCIHPETLSEWLAEKGVRPKAPPAPSPKKARLLEILEALETYAEDTGQPFDRTAMPGPLGTGWEDEGSFHWLCAKLDLMFMKSDDTFARYRNGVCKVQQWAQPSDFYREAYPHIAPTFTPLASARTRKKPI